MIGKFFGKTDWEPFCCIVGIAVTLLAVFLPIVMAISRENGWWLSLWLVTGTVCGLYWSVTKSFCDGDYR